MIAYISDGKVLSYLKAGSKTGGKTGARTGKAVVVVEEGAFYNPVIESRLGPKVVVEQDSNGQDRVRHVYTVIPKEDALESLKADVFSKLDKVFSKKASKLTKQYPPIEVSSWDQQKEEAKALKKDPLANTPMLSRIAARRGVAVSDLATKVLSKGNNYSLFIGDLIGHKQSIEDLVSIEDVTLAELISIEETLSEGWPDTNV